MAKSCRFIRHLRGKTSVPRMNEPDILCRVLGDKTKLVMHISSCTSPKTSTPGRGQKNDRLEREASSGGLFFIHRHG